MARNWVQFQKGLSHAEFHERFGTEDLCHPKCGERNHGYCAPRRLYQCTACRRQTSVRAGTIFEKSRTPLSKWFHAMHLMTSAKNDVAALELSRQLDVKWDTAWLIKQKLMDVMRKRNSIYKLEGDVQIDDAYLGGERPATPGKTGRGAANKIPFVIAVATREGRPVHTHLRRISALFPRSPRKRSRSMRTRPLPPAAGSSAMGWAASKGSPRPVCSTKRWSPAAAGRKTCASNGSTSGWET